MGYLRCFCVSVLLFFLHFVLLISHPLTLKNPSIGSEPGLQWHPAWQVQFTKGTPSTTLTQTFVFSRVMIIQSSDKSSDLGGRTQLLAGGHPFFLFSNQAVNHAFSHALLFRRYLVDNTGPWIVPERSAGNNITFS